MKEQLNNKILAVHDKITNMVFEQIDKQLELVNISMNSTSQTTNQINSYSGIPVANSGVIICGVLSSRIVCEVHVS
jgi:hypothetical protein